jgi:two-component system OmpR family sensor kinase
MKQRSIVRHLVVSLIPAVALLWLLATGISGYIIQEELNESFDNALQQTAQRLLPLALDDLHEIEEGEERRIPKLDLEETYISYYVRNASGAPIIISDDTPNAVIIPALPEGFSSQRGQRYFVLTDRETGYSIVTIELNEHRNEVFWESLSALLLPLIILLPLMGFWIWHIVRRAMQPVDDLRSDIASRDGHNLTPTTTDGYPEEIAPIARAVADLIERLRAALNAERAFAASSAHELRTPIAGALAQVQRLSIELGDHPAAQRTENINFALRHLANLSEQLLQLSRLEAGFARSETRNDLLPVLQLVLRDMTSDKANTDRLNINLPEDKPLRGQIELDAFAVIIRNLIENALKHGSKSAPIDIFIDAKGHLHIANDGPVIEKDTLSRLSEPFERGETKAEGTGLGLSIVQTIMNQIDGEMLLQSPRHGSNQGFEAILTFSTN